MILGKLPPPYMGPAIATQIILNSALSDHFQLIHVDTKASFHIESLGRFRINKLWRNLGLYIRFKVKLMRYRPDLVLIPISQTTMGFLKDALFILLAKLFFRKVLLQLRGSNFRNWINQSSGMTRLFVGKTLSLTQGIIVLGHNLKYLFEDYYPSDRIYVVPNGGDYEIPPVDRSHQPVRLLYFANLLKAKGIEDVLNACRLLLPAGNFQLDAVGSWYEPDFEAKCRRLVKENSLPVNFHPSQSGAAKWQFFAAADIFLFTPNAPEGHPWVIVEALAAGLPIISTDQGAIIESVLDGVNGFIVPSNSPGQIMEKVQLLLQNDQLRKKMGQASLDHYHQHFTEEKLVKNLKQTFEQLI